MLVKIGGNEITHFRLSEKGAELWNTFYRTAGVPAAQPGDWQSLVLWEITKVFGEQRTGGLSPFQNNAIYFTDNPAELMDIK